MRRSCEDGTSSSGGAPAAVGGEDAAESGGLQPRRKSRHQVSGTANFHEKGDNGGKESSENTAYLHENGGVYTEIVVSNRIICSKNFIYIYI